MKLTWKKILTDPAFWLLLAANIFIIYKYEQNPQLFTTLIWIYYSQNILYGLFHFTDMLTIRNADMSPLRVGPNINKTDKELISASAWGFLMIFGFFHFVYFLFLITMQRSGPMDWGLYRKFVIIFAVFQAITLVQHKLRNRRQPADGATISFYPVLRVLPMHLCILIPAFLHISNLTVFLVLKVAIDMIAYLATTRYYRPGSLHTKVTAMGTNTTLTDL